MFVLSSLYCRWQTPLFWGLPKHTFTTNNHGRVGTPAFQPALCGAPLIAKKKKSVSCQNTEGTAEMPRGGSLPFPTTAGGISGGVPNLRGPRGSETHPSVATGPANSIIRVSHHETAASFKDFSLLSPS